MMVQMRPRVRRWFPSTMSCEPMFSRWTFCSLRNCRALSTFSRQWIRMRPLVGFGCGEQKKKKGPMLQLLNLRDHSTHKSGKDDRNLKREKQVKAGGEVNHTKRKKKLSAWFSPSSWLVSEGHAEGQGQGWNRKGWFLCDTDQLFSWEHFQKAD